MGGPGSGRRPGVGANRSASKQTGLKKFGMTSTKVNSNIKLNRAKNVIAARNYKNKEKSAMKTIGVSGTKSAQAHLRGLNNKITRMKSGRY